MTLLICIDGDAVSESHKSDVFSVRLSQELSERWFALKRKYAHPRVPNSEMILEAIKMYVELAEERGLNEDLSIPNDKDTPQPTANEA